MSEFIKVGPPDVINLPHKSIGTIFYEKIKKWDPTKTLLVLQRILIKKKLLEIFRQTLAVAKY